MDEEIEYPYYVLAVHTHGKEAGVSFQNRADALAWAMWVHQQGHAHPLCLVEWKDEKTAGVIWIRDMAEYLGAAN